MRDPKRIDSFCSELAEMWKKVPDWRFGQLMINFGRYYMSEHGMDFFYLEENDFLKCLKVFMDNEVE